MNKGWVGRRGGWVRWSLLLLGGASLLLGLSLALSLLGVWPSLPPADSSAHAQAMTLGFLGTLISLERAIALRERWAMLSPAALGIGGILLLVFPPVAHVLHTLGMLLLVAVYARLSNRGLTIALSIQILGSLAGMGAAILWWAGVPTPAVIPWLTAFLVLTIVGERVELAAFALPQHAEIVAWLLALALVLGAAIVLAAGRGDEVFGLILLGHAAWLARFDIARTTISGIGLVRYAAANMLAATAWLGAAGLALVLGGRLSVSPVYDTVVHAVTIGFTLSMIMAHAPIILPAVIGKPLPYRSAFWVPTVLVNGGLLVRVLADIRGLDVMWQIGGTVLIVAQLIFVLVAAGSARARVNTTPGRQSAGTNTTESQ